jgi:NAD(P)-dependent dehydrogenase (short-subunit alcohol dehydrogenase family)
MKWTEADIPLQTGKIVVVTGANSGLGFYTSMALAGKGARVILACRDLKKGEAARQRILATGPKLEPELWELDLSSLSSVRSFSEKLLSTHGGPDLLFNNAGLMAIPYYKTSDGFEMQFGVNHLGHFALTALLWPLMKDKPGTRIVSVSSAAHHFGKIRFEDIHWDQGYSKWGAYGMSKLANLLFTTEMARRLKELDSPVIVAAAHPGYADTSLQAKSMIMAGSRGKARLFDLVNKFVAQSGEMGALPSLYAATAPDVESGSFYGPSGFMKMKGWPALEKPNPKRVIPEVAELLWKVSEDLTGIKFTLT